MFKSFASSPASPAILHSILRWCGRLAFVAAGVVLAASALVVSMLLLAFVSARAACLAVLGRGRRPLREPRPKREAFRRSVHRPRTGDVVDVESRPLS